MRWVLISEYFYEVGFSIFPLNEISVLNEPLTSSMVNMSCVLLEEEDILGSKIYRGPNSYYLD